MASMAPVLPMTEPDALAQAARELREGALVAFATDTVYGVGAPPTPAGARALYAAKGRPQDKPLPLLIASADLLPTYCVEMPPIASELAAAHWPGPLTLVVPGDRELARTLGSEDGSLAVRVPDNPQLRQLLALCGGALAVTSANRSGEDEALSAWEAEEQLGPRLSLILDGGPSRNPFPSTIVDVRPSPPVLVREGLIGAKVLALLSPPAPDAPDEADRA